MLDENVRTSEMVVVTEEMRASATSLLKTVASFSFLRISGRPMNVGTSKRSGSSVTFSEGFGVSMVSFS